MEYSIILLLILIIIGLILAYFKQNKNSRLPNEEQDRLFMMLQQQIHNINQAIDTKFNQTTQTLAESHQNINRTILEQMGKNQQMVQGIYGQSHKVITDITEKLTSLDKTNQQVIGFSEQLHNFEKLLRHQKQRGNLGEAGLQLVLENILPPDAFSMQYRFEDGTVVDAAIFSKEGIIPIDAKFSLENYERLIHEEDEKTKLELEKSFKSDLKKRIDETSKYIKPREGTLEFAFMFIPSEAIYYDLLVNEVGAVKVNTRTLVEYAFNERKVIIVSPTTFSAYLQTVLQGLRALKIEESAKTIRKHVMALQKHIVAYEEYMKKLGSSMSTTVNHYNTAYNELGKIDKDIAKIIEGEKTIEPTAIDKPKTE